MSKRTCVAALLAFAVLSIAVVWAADGKGKGKTAAELSEARLALAQRGFDMALDAYEKRERDDIDQVGEWSKRMVEVVRKESDKAKLQQSLEAHRERVQRLFDSVLVLEQTGMKSEVDKLDAEYFLLEAESWLAEANAANN